MSQQINLYDASLQKQVDWFSLDRVAIVSAACLAFIVLLAGVAHWQKNTLADESAALKPQIATAQTELKALGDQLANRKPDPKLEQELATARAILGTRGEVLTVLKKGLGPEATTQADILRGFARQAPNGLWLTGFAVNADNGAMEIRGRTTDPALIPEYVRRLSAEKAFKGRTFATLEIKSTQPSSNTPTGTVAGGPAVGAATAQPASDTQTPAPPPVAPIQTFHDFTLKSANATETAPAVAPLNGAPLNGSKP